MFYIPHIIKLQGSCCTNNLPSIFYILVVSRNHCIIKKLNRMNVRRCRNLKTWNFITLTILTTKSILLVECCCRSLCHVGSNNKEIVLATVRLKNNQLWRRIKGTDKDTTIKKLRSAVVPLNHGLISCSLIVNLRCGTTISHTRKNLIMNFVLANITLLISDD